MVCVLYGTVWPKIWGAVSYKTSGKEYAGEWFVFDAYPRVAFTVFKQYVVFGLVLLYEVVLQ